MPNQSILNAIQRTLKTLVRRKELEVERTIFSKRITTTASSRRARDLFDQCCQWPWLKSVKLVDSPQRGVWIASRILENPRLTSRLMDVNSTECC